MIRFHVAGIPVPQGSHRAFMPRGGRFPVVTDDNPRMKPWRSVVSYTAAQHRPEKLIEGPVSITLRFAMPRPKTLPKRIAAHVKRPDVDKLVRAIFDALKGVIWQDDSQVVLLSASKSYGEPGCEVLIEELPG